MKIMNMRNTDGVPYAVCIKEDSIAPSMQSRGSDSVYFVSSKYNYTEGNNPYMLDEFEEFYATELKLQPAVVKSELAHLKRISSAAEFCNMLVRLEAVSEFINWFLGKYGAEVCPHCGK